MRNVYTVKLAKPVKTEAAGAYFSGRESSTLFVVASSFEKAIEAAERKYPGVEIRGVDLMNYSGVPIVIGD